VGSYSPGEGLTGEGLKPFTAKSIISRILQFISSLSDRPPSREENPLLILSFKKPGRKEKLEGTGNPGARFSCINLHSLCINS
jgi:hypothetical protein